ncbi:MAG TPA: TOBE domain-containing protein, partial [Verrucomicrobiae bacterium]|nr:TOBE domain-containing protein [Verrucomicrobiae bacterium]
LMLGVRAEHVHLRGSRWAIAHAEAAALRARIERIEPAGDQSFLWLDAAGAPLVARVEPDFAARPGDAVELALDPGGLHLFDAASGERLA